MIPATKQQLLVSETWTKIYQSYRNAEFQSYDFDTLRRTMISYLRATYPEEFNDYIDSSEYIALVDLIAFVGQNLSFRVDLNARENFLETAQRQDSVMRLAQLISYNPKRNIPASGLLKIVALSTTDSVVDSNGINLANQVIGWNDPTNTNWYQQFLLIINSAMPSGMIVGRPSGSGIVNGVDTEQYQINSTLQDVPAFSVSKNINGVPMLFEIVGAEFGTADYFYETTPTPGGAFSFVYQNDKQGAGSADTGYFVLFKQGTLTSSPFSLTTPVPNQNVSIDANGINNTDVWLWQLDASGNYSQLWTKVDALVGNNVIYNNVSQGIKTLYSVSSRSNDQIDLNFADGKFGDIPKGNFRLFYRQSNAQTYSIVPEQMSGITISIPYQNKSGANHRITLTLSLQYTVTNSSGPETLDNIRTKAPQSYYLQNRMITAEDYNIAPLLVSPGILKVYSENRLATGVSKYFELSDVTGMYSSTDIYAKDGILYKEEKIKNIEITFNNRNQALGILKNTIEPIIRSSSFKNFYFQNYKPRPNLDALNYKWITATNSNNQTTGYFINSYGLPVQVGDYTGNNTTYVKQKALIRFEAPSNKYFLPDGTLTDNQYDDGAQEFKWVTVLQVIGDGSNNGKGKLTNGAGPIVFSGNIPSDSIPIDIIPAFVTVFSYSFEIQITNLMMTQSNFGLSFDSTTRSWFIISGSNLSLSPNFSLTYQGDIGSASLDSSWMMAFVWNGTGYTVRYRLLEYIFESDNQTAFFVDYNNNNYDYVNDTVIRDQIDVLSINKNPTDNSKSLSVDYRWQIDSSIVEIDGYVEPKKVIVGFYDSNNNGNIDTPDAFEDIVNTAAEDSQTGFLTSFVYFKFLADGNRYSLVSPQSLIKPFPSEASARNYYEQLATGPYPPDGQLFYFYNQGDDVVKQYDLASDTYTLNTNYFARQGRSKLKFHYMHNSGQERRIDPAKSNIIDIYVLTAEYNSQYRNWLLNGTGYPPKAPTIQNLENNYYQYLEPIKAVSDTIVFHSAIYKPLFGSEAPPSLQATFKAVKNSKKSLSDTDLTNRILKAINEFFAVEYWNFGQTFYFAELATYVINSLTPDITNFVIVPKNIAAPFGSLYEITANSTEIMISAASASDIQIVEALTASELNITNSLAVSNRGLV